MLALLLCLGLVLTESCHFMGSQVPPGQGHRAGYSLSVSGGFPSFLPVVRSVGPALRQVSAWPAQGGTELCGAKCSLALVTAHSGVLQARGFKIAVYYQEVEGIGMASESPWGWCIPRSQHLQERWQ